MLVKLLFILSHAIRLAWSFNVDAQSAIVAYSEADSLFGYSLSLNASALYVGAPNFRTSGAVFRCRFDGSNGANRQTSCERIDEIATGNRDFLGASLVMAQSSLLACAPRTNSQGYKDLKWQTGACYAYETSRASTRMNGNRAVYTAGRPDSRSGWSYMTMMGHALVAKPNGDLVIGAPMTRAQTFSWNSERTIGSILMVDRRTGSAFFPSPWDVAWGSNTHSTKDEPHTYDLTGTSIVRGRFFSSGDDHYAVGAPKANRLRGRVYLCPDCFRSGSDARQRAASSVHFERSSVQVNGDQFGSRFGQALCAVDINGDGFHDLVVGAPLYAEREGYYDTGAVYVYKTEVRGFFSGLELMSRNLMRDVTSGARFGHALASLGDLDQDGFGDFAVGAPYEGTGAVYIYMGNEKFLFNDKPQKLTPASVSRTSEFRGFGMSISADGRDIDGNGTPDLAIGAPTSGHAIILRSRKAVRIAPTSYVVTPSKAVRPDSNQFEVTIRAVSKATERMRATVSFTEIDERVDLLAKFGGGKNVTATIEPGASSESFKVDVRSKTDKPNFDVNVNQVDLPRDLRFEVEITWSVDTERCPTIGCPVLDPRSKFKEVLAFTVALQSGCEDISRCKCSLGISQKAQSEIKVVVGRDKTMGVQVGVTNSGSEPAFDARLTVVSDLDLVKPRAKFDCHETSSSLQETSSSLECRLPSFAPNQPRILEMTFPIGHLVENVDLTRKDLTLRLSNNCSMQDSSAAVSSRLRVVFEYVYRIVVSSLTSTLDQVEYGHNATSVPIQHAYNVTNLGPSPLNRAESYEVFIPDVDFVSVANVSGGSGCSVTKSGRQRVDVAGISAGTDVVSCGTYNCRIVSCSLPKGVVAGSGEALLVNLAFDPVAASKRNDGLRKNFAVVTFAHASDSNNPQDFAVVTTELFSGHASFVQESWPYLVGAGIGLILLVVLVIVLWKSKAFSKMRIYKSQLEDAQKLVGPKSGGEQSTELMERSK